MTAWISAISEAVLALTVVLAALRWTWKHRHPIRKRQERRDNALLITSVLLSVTLAAIFTASNKDRRSVS